MRAIVLQKTSPSDTSATLHLHEVPEKQPAPGQVVVSLRAAALNRRDVWIRLGKYAGIRLPTVLGSDGAGIVSRVGAGVSERLVGTPVIVNPALGWGPDPEAQGPDFRILGMPDDGTYAEEICVPVDNVVRKPAHLGWAEAAALPLGGLTAYRALCTRGRLRPGETVLVPGIGSGVSTLVVMLAKHLGARVVVTSSSAEKLEQARGLGVDFGVNYRDADWDQQIIDWCGGEPPHLAVDGAGGDSWARCANIVRPGGRIVSYGATAGLAQIDLRKLFWKQLNVLGSTMGTARDFAELVALVEAGRLRPRVDQVLPLEHAAEAHRRMEHGEHLGKIVLRITDWAE